jgi:hypothetical protein
MGMDIYGENPTLVKGLTEPVRPEDEHDQDIWSEYFEDKREYESKNVGVYFRANVWSWRPIWAMVEKLCDDILTEDDIKHGSFNDGSLIDAMKAELVGQRLKQNKEHIKQYCKDQKADFEVKNEFNKLLTKSAEVYLKIQKNMYPDLEITAPNDLRAIKDKDRSYQLWQLLGSTFEGLQYGETSYRLDYDHIMLFADFCENSGGFRIH